MAQLHCQLTQLTQLTILTKRQVFGVPGDFNLALLDHIYEVEGIRWAGNTNELNAGYAADGYSRIKRLAALVTTFGVGELSALAAVAGSYAEHVGLLHVVGVPSMSAQNKHLLLHHTLGNGDFTVFKSMSGRITEHASVITDITTAAEQIDKAIRTAYIYQRPVYLAIPANLSDVKLDADLLRQPINLELEPNPPEAEAEVIEVVAEMVLKADHPILLIDACASRHNVMKEVAEIARVTQFPVFTTPMGKGSFDEHDPRFGGVYVGSLTLPEVAKVVEHADLILSFGALLSDFNTGSFSYHYDTKNIVEFHSDSTKIRSATYPEVKMQLILDKVAKRLSALPQKKLCEVPPYPPLIKATPESPLKQEWLWTRLTSWLRKGDIIVSETGTSNFGIIQTKFPQGAVGISQVLWGSIGYSVGALVGATMAASEVDPSRRVILFVGDGSLQLTVTEISTLVRWGLKPYIFILNNDGYTIERLIRGEKATYNDVHMWKYSKLLDLFNAKDHDALQVSTTGELDDLFNDAKFASPTKIRTIELFLPQMDAPTNLIKQAKITAATNSE
ncbi:indolepyruvate decarboxylase 1 [Sugiyamaella lignohabitans]|uniref:Indolepyruvate decarboxylase 1 n=1 Tax=Sugiyamaella lignohabitans TaxID=796027 RepID=A0A161HH14_9ASCO|nr:indolepyruvate decarboxylase 1 [Sugiyamaella lignohabitans]ANB11237.1 indolepyruvate decarboxylase 1 [Sugiyamaella lignohabitans]